MPNLIKPTLILFHDEADQEMIKIYENVKAKSIDKASFVKVNVNKNPKIASTFKIDELPTLLAISNGKEFWRFSGKFSEEIICQNF